MADVIVKDSTKDLVAGNKNIDYLSAIESSESGVFLIDNDSDSLQFSDGFLKMLKLDKLDQYKGCNGSLSLEELKSLIHEDDLDDFEEALYSFSSGIIDKFSFVGRFKSFSGAFHWLEFYGGSVAAQECGTNNRNVITGIVIDVTQNKEYENELKQYAFHDQLTGLANRVLMNERINQAIKYCKRYKEKFSAVVFLDLNDMKEVNDKYGHAGGDELLVNVGKRLKRAVRSIDTVARFGGDEFVVVVHGVDSIRDIVLLVERLLEEMSAPINILGKEVSVGISIGVKIFNHEDKNKTKIMREADLALYQAKIKNKSNYVLYDKSMQKCAEGDVRSSSSISKAIDNDEFCMHYQPIIDIESGKIVGVEALMRWQSPDFGLIQPENFISVAEKSHLIEKLGKIALNKSCEMLANLKKQIPEAESLFVSVNVSKRQLDNFTAFKKKLLNATKEYNIAPSDIHLELTESVLMGNTTEISKMIKELKDLGFHLSIDDFGTGYSSLSYLHLYPFDVLKIDRTFISGKGKSKRAIATINMINELAKILHMKVIVEGIETKEELSMLDGMDNILVQGFKFSKPLEEQKLLEFVKASFSNARE